MDDNYERLFDSIQKQSFINVEIIIVDDNIENYKNTSVIYEKMTKNDKRIKIIKYKNYVGNLKKRIDGINASKAEYILFIDGDDYFSGYNVLDLIYDRIKIDNVDILEFKTFHYIQCQNSYIYRQPQLYDIMNFGQDIFYNPKQKHVSGKIIKKKLLLHVIKNFDDVYLNQVINYYEENMLLLLLLKNAESFEMLDIHGTGKSCRSCMNLAGYGNAHINKDLLLYLKLIIKYGGNNVPERRSAAYFFINYVVYRQVHYKNNSKLLNEVTELYLACDKISEHDKAIIRNYQNKNK